MTFEEIIKEQKKAIEFGLNKYADEFIREDIRQDVYIRIFKYLNTLNELPDKRTRGSYILRIIHHASIAYFRKNKYDYNKISYEGDDEKEENNFEEHFLSHDNTPDKVIENNKVDNIINQFDLAKTLIKALKSQSFYSKILYPLNDKIRRRLKNENTSRLK